MYKVVSKSVVRLSLARAALSEGWSKQVLLFDSTFSLHVLCILPLSSSLFSSFLRASLYLNFYSLILVHLLTGFYNPWDSRILPLQLPLLLLWLCCLNLGSLPSSFPLQVLCTWCSGTCPTRKPPHHRGGTCCNCTCLDASCSCFTAVSVGSSSSSS